MLQTFCIYQRVGTYLPLNRDLRSAPPILTPLWFISVKAVFLLHSCERNLIIEGCRLFFSHFIFNLGTIQHHSKSFCAIKSQR